MPGIDGSGTTSVAVYFAADLVGSSAGFTQVIANGPMADTSRMAPCLAKAKWFTFAGATAKLPAGKAFDLVELVARNGSDGRPMLSDRPPWNGLEAPTITTGHRIA